MYELMNEILILILMEQKYEKNYRKLIIYRIQKTN